MEIRDAQKNGKVIWNAFIKEHFPPVGAFMQTWEWGEFQKTLGRKIERYFVADNFAKPIAAFTIVYHPLPFGFFYGYSPRGPIIANHLIGSECYIEVLENIKHWAKQNLKHLIFLRFEPPLSLSVQDVQNIKGQGFKIPSYYIQPRQNLFISLKRSESEIAKGFHSSTRSNISRAVRRGVRVEAKEAIDKSDIDNFFSMAEDTITRNSGKNVYPDRFYFDSLVAVIPKAGREFKLEQLELGMRHAYQNENLAAAQFTLFFGDTATYLYGASYTDRLSSKATTYLHWVEMREAKRKGFKYYDLGGIDEILWPTLTNFKRQFRGEELNYVGNIDIPLRPKIYMGYNFLRRF